MARLNAKARSTIRSKRQTKRLPPSALLMLLGVLVLTMIGTVVIVGPMSSSENEYVFSPSQSKAQAPGKHTVVTVDTAKRTAQAILGQSDSAISSFGSSSSSSSLSVHLPGDGKPAKVAYAVSLIECTDHHKSGHASVAGLQDASIVLRHSIHQNSVQNPQSGSRYDYEMYAIVHEQAKACAPVLEDAGFKILIRDPPILASEIHGDFLRNNIQKEYCCGAHEFVKLYAYQIPAPLVVHLDIDFIFRKPMDAVFDVMLGATDEATRAKVEREDPKDPWPADVETMITRDYTSAYPGRKAGFQAGFWVLKPSQKHFDNLLAIIREGNYVAGFEPTNGWGGMGYGGFIGAKAMQGLMAYYYDIHVPGTWVELNNCRYNAVRAIVTKRGKCLSGRSTCEDCRTTKIEDIYSIHYTACRKPWSCIASKADDPTNQYPRKNSMPVDIVHFDQCMESRRVWHEYRRDLESKLYDLTKDEGVLRGNAGEYNKEYFLGHCKADQSSWYLRLGGSPETIKRIPELYQNKS